MRREVVAAELDQDVAQAEALVAGELVDDRLGPAGEQLSGRL